MKIKCNWCKYEFEPSVSISGDDKGRISRSQLKCPNCTNLLPSSIKIKLENSHFHKNY